MVNFAPPPPSTVLTDAEIARLIAARKPLPYGLPNPILASTNRQLRADFNITAEDGEEFRVYIRQLEEDSLDFSAILVYRMRSAGTWIILRRYNGKSHEHRNRLDENVVFFDYHIHTATERYQRARGLRAETYAEITSRYVDLPGAIECLIEDCGFYEPDRDPDLFDTLMD